MLYHSLSLVKTGKFAEVAPARLYYLRRRGYIGRIGNTVYILPKAERALTESRVWALTIPQPKKWDGKWRLVMFDIPADKRKRRDAFRVRLRELGLALYQNSVWIYPYPLEQVIVDIASFYKLSGCVSLVLAEKISQEKFFRSLFKL